MLHFIPLRLAQTASYLGFEPGCCCIMYSNFWSAFANPSSVNLATSEKRSFSHSFPRSSTLSSFWIFPIFSSSLFFSILLRLGHLGAWSSLGLCSVVRNVSLYFTRARVSVFPDRLCLRLDGLDGNVPLSRIEIWHRTMRYLPRWFAMMYCVAI